MQGCVNAGFSQPRTELLHAPDPMPLVQVLLSEEVYNRGELELDRYGDHVVRPGIQL